MQGSGFGVNTPFHQGTNSNHKTAVQEAKETSNRHEEQRNQLIVWPGNRRHHGAILAKVKDNDKDSKGSEENK